MQTSSLLTLLKERGYIHQITDEKALSCYLKEHTHIPIYIGFDCTAPTLHVGSLVQIMILRIIQSFGYTPIILFGGGTTKVGDPSGKDETRKLITEDIINENLQGIKHVFSQFINIEKAILVNNDDWLKNLSYIDFLRDIGKHFSVNRMLSFESVKLRLEREQNLSFLEFNYMLLQAYDFVKLHQDYDCRIQIGGSDQWGNIVNGIELNRRLGQKEIFGITTPLITTASGAKMGKTAQGAVWLSEKDLPSYEYWQFWRNTEDADVSRFLRLFTDLPLDEIQKLEALEGSDINEAKKILANEATTLCHGKQAANNAEKTAQQTFEQGTMGDALPTITVNIKEIEEGIPLYKLLHLSNLCATGGEAKRVVKGGGAKVNDQKILDAFSLVTKQDIQGEGVIKLSSGKKKHALVKVCLS